MAPSRRIHEDPARVLAQWPGCETPCRGCGGRDYGTNSSAPMSQPPAASASFAPYGHEAGGVGQLAGAGAFFARNCPVVPLSATMVPPKSAQ